MAVPDFVPPQDVAVFHSLQREATAKVIALQALPARRLLPAALVILLSIALSASFGFAIGQIPHSELSWEKVLAKSMEETGMPFIVVLPPAIALSLIGIVNLVLRRAQIATSYLEGKILKVSKTNLADPRSPVDALGKAGFAQLNAVTFGLTLLPAGVGGLAGANVQTTDSMPWWTLLLFLVGLSLLTWAGPLLVMRVRGFTATEWRHPQPLPPIVDAPKQVAKRGFVLKRLCGRDSQH